MQKGQRTSVPKLNPRHNIQPTGTTVYVSLSLNLENVSTVEVK